MAGAATAGTSQSQSSDACASQAVATNAATAERAPEARSRRIPAKPLRGTPVSNATPTIPVCPRVRNTMLCGYSGCSRRRRSRA